MFIGKLPKGMTVYGEIVGWVNGNTPIMPSCANSKEKDKAFSKQHGDETVFLFYSQSHIMWAVSLRIIAVTIWLLLFLKN